MTIPQHTKELGRANKEVGLPATATETTRTAARKANRLSYLLQKKAAALLSIPQKAGTPNSNRAVAELATHMIRRTEPDRL